MKDGCGGTCPCPEGYQQNAQGEWVPADECSDDCANAGWSCGSLCGRACGSCASDASCKLGQCACVPKCDGTRCEDGCGGTCACKAGSVCDPSKQCVPEAQCEQTCTSEKASCGKVCGHDCGKCEGLLSCISGACQESVTCTDCTIQLRLLDKRAVAGNLMEITLGVDYSPGAEAARPRLADLRIVSDHEVQLAEAKSGEATDAAQKELYRDPKAGTPFRAHPDGSYQVMVFAVGNTEPIEAGRLATLRFTMKTADPVSFSIARRFEVLAPPLADTILQSSPYDRALVVTP